MSKTLEVIGLLAVYVLGKSVNVVALKRAQKGTGSIFQHMTFTCLFTFLQGVLLFAMPPYAPLEFVPERLLLPAMYATFYVIYMIFTVNALRTGPTSLTQIIASFNPLFPVFLGVLCWGDEMNWIQWAGLALFCVSLFLFNSGDYREADEKKPITLKWAVLALTALAFSGSAVCCTRRYCDTFGGYIKEYLIFYCLVAVLWTLPFVIVGFTKHRKEIVVDRAVFGWTGAAALSCDASNIIFMLYASAFDAAFYFPLMSVLGVAAIMLSSVWFLKEKVSRKAIIGIIVSAAALALLAI